MGAGASHFSAFPSLASRAPARTSESGNIPAQHHRSRMPVSLASPCLAVFPLSLSFCLCSVTSVSLPSFLRPGCLPFLACFELMKSGAPGQGSKREAASGRRSRLFDLRRERGTSRDSPSYFVYRRWGVVSSGDVALLLSFGYSSLFFSPSWGCLR